MQFLFKAGFAKAKQFQTMIDDFELMFLGFAVLKPFNRFILKFDNLAATNADKMVVMPAALRAFIELFPVAKVLLFKDFAFFQ